MLFFSDRDTGLFLFWSSVAGLSPTRGGWFLVLKMTTLLAGATYHYLKKDVLTKMFHNLKSKPIGRKNSLLKNRTSTKKNFRNPEKYYQNSKS